MPLQFSNVQNLNLSAGFHTKDAVTMIKTDVFDSSIQIYRLPLNWNIGTYLYAAASAGKNPLPCKVVFGIFDNKFNAL